MAPIADVWRAWTTPEGHQAVERGIQRRHTTAATVDLRVGGGFSSRMEARTAAWDSTSGGTYTAVVPNRLLELGLGDGRTVQIEFSESPAKVTIRETFDAEPTHSPEHSVKAGAILNRFVQHVEANRKGDA